MCKYTVLDDHEASRETVLLDGYGKLHLASGWVVRPALGEVMHGPRPALGFHVLSAEASHRSCTANFLLIDCQHVLVLVRWARSTLRQRRRAESSCFAPLQSRVDVASPPIDGALKNPSQPQAASKAAIWAIEGASSVR